MIVMLLLCNVACSYIYLKVDAHAVLFLKDFMSKSFQLFVLLLSQL